MYAPKHAKSKRIPAKAVVLLLAAVCLLSAAVGGVYAYLRAQTPPLTNRFDPVEVTCAVEEDFDGVTKQNVSIRNTGDIDAYIRAAVVVNRADEDGNLLTPAPLEGTDYTVTWGNSDWVKGSDGFWYYRRAVAAGAATANLIETLTPVTAGQGVHLQVQIVATAIQAAPATAVQEAWGVTVTGGIVTPA